MFEITDFPLWPNFPYPLPSWLEARCGKVEDQSEMVIINSKDDLAHIWHASVPKKQFDSSVLAPMVNNIIGARLDHEFPGMGASWARREAMDLVESLGNRDAKGRAHTKAPLTVEERRQKRPHMTDRDWDFLVRKKELETVV